EDRRDGRARGGRELERREPLDGRADRQRERLGQALLAQRDRARRRREALALALGAGRRLHVALEDRAPLGSLALRVPGVDVAAQPRPGGGEALLELEARAAALDLDRVARPRAGAVEQERLLRVGERPERPREVEAVRLRHRAQEELVV